MSCIHFKFKNRQDYEKVPISGLEISGKELKEGIMKKKKIGHSNLEITDAQTKKVYSDTDMIKRNATVIVMRSVIQNAAKLPKTQHKDPSLLPSAVCESSFSRGLFHCFSPSLYLPYMCVPCLSKWTLISAIFAGLTTTSRICFCTATTPSFSLSLVLIHSNVSVLK
jgi:hypothetical protein